MSHPNSPKSPPQTSLETSVSSLPLHSNQLGISEEWGQPMRDDRLGLFTPPNGSQTHVSGNEATPNDNMGTRGKKSLGEMLRRHVEKGRSLNLSDEDEENLSEELGKWINSNSSPYERDDIFFPPDKNDVTRSRTDDTSEKVRDAESEPKATSS